MNKKILDERPIDPTKNAQDIIGDTTGLTGITTSSPQQGGAEPDEAIPDSSHLPGTLVNEPNAHPTYGVPKEATSTKVYNKNITEGMSEEEARRNEDIATEKDVPSPIPSGNTSPPAQTLQGAQTIQTSENVTFHTDNIMYVTDSDPLTQDQGQINTEESPDEAGEQSVSGDMPTPDSDDDTLANAQAVGTQEDEDPEHPQELDIGRDIDKAEEEILES